MIRRRVVVGGHVQGVFFRDSCRELAARRGVSGWVANQDNGTVEAVFEGESADVEALVDWCHGGPAHARVGRVEVFEEQPQNEGEFRVV
jgi:acylphosphatase